jgi:hypothetical protein
MNKKDTAGKNNAFHDEICQSLPRVLSLLDSDLTSKSYGVADRYFWAWGLTDFGNGTFQGIANGLSQLWVSGLWPYQTNFDTFVERIDSLFSGAKKLTQKDGSLEEAFPREGSYCVTALVAFDLLVTLEHLDPLIGKKKKQEWLGIVEPMIQFLIESDESHAFISNHLATAAAALFRWYDITKQEAGSLPKGELLISRILQNQSKEGWFKEYEGADPGYQTLCTYYLADLHLRHRHLNLLNPLSKSLKFLWHFAHPDGSFGGYYGSRSTRFYNPGGILALRKEIPEAQALSSFMIGSLEEFKVVSLSSMDEPNLVPMFNSFAWSASLMKKSLADGVSFTRGLKLPCNDPTPLRKKFLDAGLLIDRGSDFYTVVNFKKGGVVQHYEDNTLSIVNTGVVFQNANGKFGSNQTFDDGFKYEIGDKTLKIHNQVMEMPKKLPSPFQFLLLRLCCFTFFRSSVIREFTKRILVNYLITRQKKWPVWNEREICLGKKLVINDKQRDMKGFTEFKTAKPFVPIHMASKGYWQVQDEIQNNDTSL